MQTLHAKEWIDLLCTFLVKKIESKIRPEDVVML
jgi:hypothetical protein